MDRVYTWNSMELLCKNCSNKFKTYPSRIKIGKGLFCSKNCWQEYHDLKLICKNCGKEFLYPKSQSLINCCSKECMISFRASNKETRGCRTCGKDFVVYLQRDREGRGKFCSSVCYWKSLEIPEEVRKEHQREHTREYRANNRDKTASWKHKRRALQSNSGGTFTDKQWEELKNSHNNKCAVCGQRKKLTVDHIIPLSKWKEWFVIHKVDYLCNDIQNIQPLCINCNSQKSWLIK